MASIEDQNQSIERSLKGFQFKASIAQLSTHILIVPFLLQWLPCYLLPTLRHHFALVPYIQTFGVNYISLLVH